MNKSRILPKQEYGKSDYTLVVGVGGEGSWLPRGSGEINLKAFYYGVALTADTEA